MKTLPRLISTGVLPLLFLMGSAAALAADKDGDGIRDLPLAVSAGMYYTCAIDNSGLHCWGSAGSLDLVNPVAVSAGGGHTCALDDTGVHCWGGNGDGQTTVPALVNPIAVSAGFCHTCAQDDAGVHCWGDNYIGQSTVPPLSNPIAVTTGGHHTCALDNSGVHCWGDNWAGQTDVPPLQNPVAVDAGQDHTCAIDNSGVHCWGADFYKQISAMPALVNPVAVSAGGNHTCALDDSGVHCWGAGQTAVRYPGSGSYPDYGQSVVPSLSHPVVVSAGDTHTCAIDDSGVHCWGDNDFDQTTVPLLVVDNCPAIVNPNQSDTDYDGIGDACDRQPYGSVADHKGTAVAFAGDMNGDGFGDYVIGIPGFDISATALIKPGKKNAGRALVISGKDGSVVRAINGVTAGDAMGFAVAGGDGLVVVGSPHAGKHHGGSATTLSGPDGAHTRTNHYGQKNAPMGEVIALGDVNGDGHADVIVGKPNADDTRDSAHKIIDAGSVTIYNGGNLDDVLNVFYGKIAKAHAGTSVAVGDVDNDGKADIIVGAPNDEDVDSNLKDTGSVTVYKYNNWSAPLLKKYGTSSQEHFGASVASGDVNKDGYADVIVGAPGFDNGKLIDAGSVSVISGANGSVITTQFSIVAKAGLGNSVAAGDVNSDGFADIIAGAKLDDKPGAKVIKDTGSVTVWSGSDYSLIATKYGDLSKDYFGSSVSVGDINSDGKADLVIGIPGKDIPATLTTKIIKDAGAVQVVSGAVL